MSVLRRRHPAAPARGGHHAKLTATQLIILAAAAKRDDGAILPLPKKLKLDSQAGATVFQDLLKKRLIAEKAASREAGAWRDGEDGQRIMLVATTAGRRASGAAAANERTVTPKAGMKGRRGSKRPAPAGTLSSTTAKASFRFSTT